MVTSSMLMIKSAWIDIHPVDRAVLRMQAGTTSNGFHRPNIPLEDMHWHQQSSLDKHKPPGGPTLDWAANTILWQGNSRRCLPTTKTTSAMSLLSMRRARRSRNKSWWRTCILSRTNCKLAEVRWQWVNTGQWPDRVEWTAPEWTSVHVENQVDAFLAHWLPGNDWVYVLH